MGSWKKFLPDYRLKLWNEDNLPKGATFLSALIKYKKWAFVADYVRLYALYHEGGLYFDTDIEIVKNFDDLLKEKCFIGFQQKNFDHSALNGAVIGTEPFHPYIGDCLKLSTYNFYHRLKPLLLPALVTTVAETWGLNHYGDQYLRDVKILPAEAFYPYHWEETFYPACVTENTYTIHWWAFSWKRRRGFKTLWKSFTYKTERLLFMLFHRQKSKIM